VIRRLVIGSRSSELAMRQAQSVVDKLRLVIPETAIEIRTISTIGDRDKETELHKMSAVGVFVKELEKALERHEIDLAVHSLKDMPAKQPADLVLSAVLEREDPGDVMVSNTGCLHDLPPGSDVGTGSLRRSIQLKLERPDLITLPLRGNIETRLRKLDEGKYQAIIMAAAALKRLGLGSRITQYLPVDVFVPAGCQGIIGIEIRKEDTRLDELLKKLNHMPSWHEASAERAFLNTLGAGCHAPVGVKATCFSRDLTINAMAAKEGGDPVIFDSIKGDIFEAEKLGVRLAREFAAKGAPDFIG